MSGNENIDQLAIKTIRMVCADAVQEADSGHPGMPMGMADVAYVLWTRHLRFNPDDPLWANRDRFVLSAGHGSALLYTMLHLCEYDFPLEQIKQFRQLGSITPGHPEYDILHGVECTTGPLGQGFGNGVGMALASYVMAEKFNTDDYALIDHYVYAICSDGDLMEGVASEAASFAGHLGLGNIIYIYDDNHITIEGETELTYSEDVAKRFDAYNWHVERADPYDPDAVDAAIRAAQAETEKPSLIITRSHIGYGSPNMQDTADVHGAPLGEEELEATKEALNWPKEPRFLIPDEVREVFAERVEKLKPEYTSWELLLEDYREEYPALADEWDAMWTRRAPDGLYEELIEAVGAEEEATRNSGGSAIQVVSERVPALLGGSADLAPSTKTDIKSSTDLNKGNFGGKNIHFGVREHAMGAICNGMALYGSFIPYGSTFTVFADYMRPPIRMAAISDLQVIWVFTHDSIFVGEDGPTHQPVEQIPSLRAMPGLTVLRPGDGAETAAAWMIALEHRDGPTAMFLTRQKLPPLPKPDDPELLKRGGYILSDCEGEPEVILIGTGSETQLALGAAEELREDGVAARAVSMPSTDVFEQQDEEYRESVLPEACDKRVVIEATSAIGWGRYVGRKGLVIAQETFGESAPYTDLQEHFGFTVEQVLTRIKEWM